MSCPDSVGGDERLRLFLGLRLPETALDAVEAWQAEHLAGPAGLGRVRPVPREHLHVTLAFLGHRPASDLEGILGALREAAADAPADLRLAPARYRETGSVAMLVLEDVGGGATLLARDVQARLEALGVYRREGRPWLPHLTLARFRARPGLDRGGGLELPAVGTCVPSDAAAYLSRLRPGGAEYDVLESVALPQRSVGG
jgi:2'-5' RNA ligase